MSSVLSTIVVTSLLISISINGVAQDQTKNTSESAVARGKKMEEARQFAQSGKEFVLNAQGKSEESSNVYIFYNNPYPLCYYYIIPGKWKYSPQEDAYRSEAGQSYISLDFMLSQRLKKFEGSTDLERLKNLTITSYEAQLGQRLSGVEVAAFQSPRSETWKWRADPVPVQGGLHHLPPKIFVALDTVGFASITVSGTNDDDEFVRRILGTMKTTHSPDCFWKDLEAVLKSIYPD